MEHNESKAERTPEPSKPSKFNRVKSAAITTMWIAVPVAVTGGMTYLGYKTTKMQLETAKLNLAAAKLTQQ